MATCPSNPPSPAIGVDQTRIAASCIGHVTNESFTCRCCRGTCETPASRSTPIPRARQLLIGALGVEVPLPRVLEGRDLRRRASAVFLGEEDAVILAAIERRVEIDEVHRLVADVAAQHVEVVAVEKLVVSH